MVDKRWEREFFMKKPVKTKGLDPATCANGYYWVRDKVGKPKMTKIMEVRGGVWWDMGWDIPEPNMGKFIVLGEVAPYAPKESP